MAFVTPYRRLTTIAAVNGVTNGNNLLDGQTGDVVIEDITDSITLKGANLTTSDIPHSKYKIVGVQAQLKNQFDNGSPLNSIRVKIFKTDTGVVEIFSNLSLSGQQVVTSNLLTTGNANNVRLVNGGVLSSSTPASTVDDFRLELRINDDSPNATWNINGNSEDPSPALRFFYVVTPNVHILNSSKLSITGNSKLVVE